MSSSSPEHCTATTKLSVSIPTVAFLLLVWILVPPLRTPAAIPDIYLGFAAILAIAGVWTLRVAVAGGGMAYTSPVVYWILAFAACIGMSLLAAAIAGRAVSARDITELVRPFLYLGILVVAMNAKLSASSLQRLYRLLLGFLVVSALFGLAQYFNIADVNQTVSPVYAPTQMLGLLRNRRITGTTGNPNEFGALMVLASCLALSWGLFARRLRQRALSGLLLVLFTLAMLLTSSRAALIVWAVSIGLILLVLYPRWRGAGRALPAVLLIVGVAVAMGFLLPDELFARASSLRDLAQDSSWQVRLLKWREAVDSWRFSPLLGWGPAERTMVSTVDNEWILVLRRYGLIGLIGFTGMGLSLFASVWTRPPRKREHHPQLALSVALQAALIGYAVYMIPSSVYHSLQLMPILLLLVGLCASQRRSGATCRDTLA